MFILGISLTGGAAKPTPIVLCTFPLRIVRISANHKDAVWDYGVISKVKCISVAITGLCVDFFLC